MLGLIEAAIGPHRPPVPPNRLFYVREWILGSGGRRSLIGLLRERCLGVLLTITALFLLSAPVAGATSDHPAAASTLSFHSAPNLHPPALSVTADPDRTSGDIFLTPFNSQQLGPMILDSQGRLVWFHPLRRAEALNLQVQRYRGQAVLTWWRGQLAVGHGTIYGRGEDVLTDSSYRTVAVVRGAHGYIPDLHEFQITPRGTALLDEYVPVHRDLSSLGGTKDGTVLDCVIQEIDIQTGKLLWEWHSLAHVPVSASYWPVPTSSGSWDDYFHINSIQLLPDGNLLISARDTWGIYEISRSTGQVLWTLGGKQSSFTMGTGTNFEWQHDARLHPGGVLSLFDDASFPPEEPQGSAKVLRINTSAMTAQLLRRYTHSPALLPALAGNAQVLPNRDVFVGWGGAPDFSEYSPSGRQIFNGRFPSGQGSYRALRFEWTGHPVTRPAMANAQGPHGELIVYASWNGSTQVARWRVLGGRRPGALRPLGHPVLKRGFETTIRPHAQPRYLAVQALDSSDHVLGTSNPQLRAR